MKKGLLLGLIPLIFFTVSCSKEELGSDDNGKDKITIGAQFEGYGEDTKASENNGKFAWEAGDKIGIAKKDGSGFEEYTSETQGNKADFIGNNVALAKYAVYPLSIATKVENDVLTVTLPETYNITNHTTTSSPMLATFEGDTPSSLSFAHLAGLLRFTIDALPDDANKLVFSTSSGITGTFNVESDGSDYIIKQKSAADDNQTVTINFSKKESETNNVMFYIPLPVGTYNGYELKIYNESDVLVGYAVSTSSFTLNRKGLGHKNISLSTTPGSSAGSAIVVSTTQEAEEAYKAAGTTDPTLYLKSSKDVTVWSLPEAFTQTDATSSELNIEYLEAPASITVNEYGEPSANKASRASRGVVTITVPTKTGDATNIDVTLNTPSMTVNIINGGEGTLNITKLVSRTANETLVLGERIEVTNLQANGGSLRLGDATVETLTLSDAYNGTVALIDIDGTVNSLEIQCNNVELSGTGKINSVSDKRTVSEGTITITNVAVPAEDGSEEKTESVSLPTTGDTIVIITSDAAKELKAAFDNATETGATYTLVGSLDISEAGLVLGENKKLTLDLNGHTLITTNDSQNGRILIKGELTIKDSGSNGKIQGDLEREGTGSLIVYGGTFTDSDVLNCVAEDHLSYQNGSDPVTYIVVSKNAPITSMAHLQSRIPLGGTVNVDSALEGVLDFMNVTLSENLTLNINAVVEGIKLGGNTDDKNVIVNVAKDVEYPQFTFNTQVKNYTISGDVSTDQPLSYALEKSSGLENFTIKNVKATGAARLYLGGETITVQNCVAENMNQTFIDIISSSNVKVLNNTVSFDPSANPSSEEDMRHGMIFRWISGKQLLVEGNTVNNAKKHGIFLGKMNDGDIHTPVIISNNTINGAVEDGIKTDNHNNVKVTGNTIDVTEYGIRIDRTNAGTATVVITDNVISSANANDSYGIRVRHRDHPGAVEVNLTAKDNIIGPSGMASDLYFIATDTDMTISGDYELPFTIVEGSRYITNDNGFGLKNAAAMMWFENEVNENKNLFTGKTVKLLDNITLSGDWTPIGQNADAAPYFAGTFNGNGKTIYGLTVNQEAGEHAAGLFGGLRGVVENLIIDGAKISNVSKGNSNGDTVNGTAVVAGSMVYADNVSIKNVTVRNSTVSGNRYVAGIAGYVQGNIIGCTVENSSVTSTPDYLIGKYDNGDKAAAIAGYLAKGSATDNTVATVTVHAYRDMAGVVGNAGEGVVVTGNKVTDLTLEQDYTILSEPKETVAAIVGRKDKPITESDNTATDVTIIRIIMDGVTYSDDVFEISNTAGLKWVADITNGKIANYLVNEGSGDNGLFATQTVKLTADIDLSSIENWIPIGYDNENKTNHKFAGDFDGGNYTVSNLTINNPKIGDSDFFSVGLIGYSLGNIRNLKLKDVNITGVNCVGVIAGACINHKIENCHVDGGTVTCTSDGEHAGGIVGLANESTNNGLIKGCSVKNLTITSNNNVGGLVGAGNPQLSGNTVDKVKLETKQNSGEGKGQIGEFVGWNLGATIDNDNKAENVTIVKPQ